MTRDELSVLVSGGESSVLQFKERLGNDDSIAAEIVAMANSNGGRILFGVDGKTGGLKGFGYDEVQRIGNRLGSIASQLVHPVVYIQTENVEVGEGCHVIVATVPEGVAKPYKDQDGRIWVKQACDKRRVVDNNEQIRLFQASGLLYADEMIVPRTAIEDIAVDKVRDYLRVLENSPDSNDYADYIPDKTKMTNIGAMSGDSLTLAGLLFLGKNPQRFRPEFAVKAISFAGNDRSGDYYRDSEDISGTIPELSTRTMSFLTRNLHHLQADQDFNSVGKLEIPEPALEEIVQNALIHRDYSINASVLVFIFDNRVEIISPGVLPNSLTIEKIKNGNAVTRNNQLVTYASRLMKYRGAGTGVMRALRWYPSLELVDDREAGLFKAIFPRPAF